MASANVSSHTPRHPHRPLFYGFALVFGFPLSGLFFLFHIEWLQLTSRLMPQDVRIHPVGIHVSQNFEKTFVELRDLA